MPDTILSTPWGMAPRTVSDRSLPPPRSADLLQRILDLPTLDLSQIPNVERLRLHAAWGDRLEELLSLRDETDPVSFRASLLRMGQSLEGDERDAEALAVYRALREFGGEG